MSDLLTPERIEGIRRAHPFSPSVAALLAHIDALQAKVERLEQEEEDLQAWERRAGACVSAEADARAAILELAKSRRTVERLERALSELSKAGSRLASDYASDCYHSGGDHKLCWAMCGKVCSVAEWERTLGDCGVALDPLVKRAAEAALRGEP